MQVLVDGDISAYRCAAVSENEPLDICLVRLERQLQEILYVTDSDRYQVFLSGKNNFRKKVFPEYKANRKDKPPPKYLQDCRQYLIDNWNAVVSDGCEADDLLGAQQTNDTVICSIDKDLLQIPGKHFNFVKNEWFDQTLFGGIKHFYLQLLIGDRADNIDGIAGIGPKKAEKYLEGCETEQELFDTVRGIYNNDELLNTYGKCLWIWRSANDIWDISRLTGESLSNSGEEEPLGSTQTTPEASSLSMELTQTETDGYQPLGH